MTHPPVFVRKSRFARDGLLNLSLLCSLARRLSGRLSTLQRTSTRTPSPSPAASSTCRLGCRRPGRHTDPLDVDLDAPARCDCAATMQAPNDAATLARPPARPAAPAASFRPLARTPSASSTLAWNNAHPPASGAHDLPESAAMAGLERTTSQTSVRSVRSRATYAGGAGIPGRGRSRSMRAPVVVGREGRIEEDSEVQVVDEEIAVGEHDEAIEETDEEANRMYARFSPRRKRAIVGIVAYAALLARECPACIGSSRFPLTLSYRRSLFLLVFSPLDSANHRRPAYVRDRHQRHCRHFYSLHRHIPARLGAIQRHLCVIPVFTFLRLLTFPPHRRPQAYLCHFAPHFRPGLSRYGAVKVSRGVDCHPNHPSPRLVACPVRRSGNNR